MCNNTIAGILVVFLRVPGISTGKSQIHLIKLMVNEILLLRIYQNEQSFTSRFNSSLESVENIGIFAHYIIYLKFQCAKFILSENFICMEPFQCNEIQL